MAERQGAFANLNVENRFDEFDLPVSGSMRFEKLPNQSRSELDLYRTFDGSMGSVTPSMGRPDFGTGAPPDMSMPQAIPTQREPSMTQSDMDRAMANNKLADEMAPNYALPSSPRPKPRPANLGTMGQTRPQLRR